MNEMRQLIGKRLEGDGTPRQRQGVFPSSATPRSMDTLSAAGIASTLQELVFRADDDLSRAASNYGTVHEGLKLLTTNFIEVFSNHSIQRRGKLTTLAEIFRLRKSSGRAPEHKTTV